MEDQKTCQGCEEVIVGASFSCPYCEKGPYCRDNDCLDFHMRSCPESDEDDGEDGNE